MGKARGFLFRFFFFFFPFSLSFFRTSSLSHDFSRSQCPSLSIYFSLSQSLSHDFSRSQCPSLPPSLWGSFCFSPVMFKSTIQQRRKRHYFCTRLGLTVCCNPISSRVPEESTSAIGLALKGWIKPQNPTVNWEGQTLALIISFILSEGTEAAWKRHLTRTFHQRIAPL